MKASTGMVGISYTISQERVEGDCTTNMQAMAGIRPDPGGSTADNTLGEVSKASAMVEDYKALLWWWITRHLL